MYSWEIDNIVRQYNYRLPSSVYLEICRTSPQLIYIGRQYEGNIKIVAKDENDDKIEYPEWVVDVYKSV